MHFLQQIEDNIVVKDLKHLSLSFMRSAGKPLDKATLALGGTTGRTFAKEFAFKYPFLLWSLVSSYSCHYVSYPGFPFVFYKGWHSYTV